MIAVGAHRWRRGPVTSRRGSAAPGCRSPARRQAISALEIVDRDRQAQLEVASWGPWQAGGEHRSGRSQKSAAASGRDISRPWPWVRSMRDEVLDDEPNVAASCASAGQSSAAKCPGSPMPTRMPLVERDLEPAGSADRLHASQRMLRRRALVRDQIGVHGLQHQTLRRGHIP